MRKAKVEMRKSKRESQNAKCETRKVNFEIILFSAQVHVGLKDEIRVSKSRSPKTFCLIAQCLYLFKDEIRESKSRSPKCVLSTRRNPKPKHEVRSCAITRFTDA